MMITRFSYKGKYYIKKRAKKEQKLLLLTKYHSIMKIINYHIYVMEGADYERRII